ncbi:MAG: hypothetical protein J3R72DRAFT_447102 [Linnemannia gamsii]|nr:MAG: hypothetical protein J3R72DRAFT_447102 [Linnemannia gamsii]
MNVVSSFQALFFVLPKSAQTQNPIYLSIMQLEEPLGAMGQHILQPDTDSTIPIHAYPIFATCVDPHPSHQMLNLIHIHST